MHAGGDGGRGIDHAVHVVRAEGARGASPDALLAGVRTGVPGRRLQQLAVDDVERAGRATVVVEVDTLM